MTSQMTLIKRQNSVQSDNFGPVLGVLVWFLLIITFLFVITRIATKYALSRRLGADDFVILGALVRKISP